jgi:hypothetical protein
MPPVLRFVVGVCALSMTAALHAATPITLPLGDLGLHADPELALPVPPPPRANRPDVTTIRLIIKQRQPGGCSGEDVRRSLTERRQVTTQPDPWAKKPVWSRLG